MVTLVVCPSAAPQPDTSAELANVCTLVVFLFIAETVFTITQFSNVYTLHARASAAFD
jgi:hypothetical protein